jgi:hypothetical protein
MTTKIPQATRIPRDDTPSSTRPVRLDPSPAGIP